MLRNLLLVVFTLAIVLGGGATAQSATAVMVKDINVQPKFPASSSPAGISHRYHEPAENRVFATIGPRAYFRARGLKGEELYGCLHTPNSALLIKDINPAGSSYPNSFTVVNNILYFGADDGVHGEELWRSDGSTAGTWMVKDCRTGSKDGQVLNPVAMGNKLYFMTYNGSTYDLWCSTGVTPGTTIVKAGFRGNWYQPIVLGNKIIFRGGDSTSNRYEPWVTDGTAAGTFMLKDINPGTSYYGFHNPVVLGSVIYFAGYDGAGYGMWKTDGTTANTVKVTSNGFYSTTYWHMPIALGSKIVFRGRTTTTGYEPWVTDGTAAGTILLKDIRSGTNSGYFNDPVVFNNNVYFESYLTNGSAYAIWKTDGTPAGTQLVSSKVRYFNYPKVYKGEIYFSGRSPNTVNNGYELWKTDGTNLGTVEVKDIQPGVNSSSLNYLTPTLSGMMLFAANDGVTGTEMWVTDGTGVGTRLVQDLRQHLPGSTEGAYPNYLLNLYGTTYFQANDGKTGTELWKTDGTTAGTVLVKDVDPFISTSGSPSSGTYLGNSYIPHWRYSGEQRQPTAVGNKLIFRGRTQATGYEPWVTDGTTAGTFMLRDIYPGTNSGYFYFGTVLGGHVYFMSRASSGYCLWKTDGTTAGTVKVSSTVFNYNWMYPITFGDKIIFCGRMGNSSSNRDYEPWVTDGTAAGTKKLADLNPTLGSSYYGFAYPVIMNDFIYFAGYDGTTYNLYRTNGLVSGTVKITNSGFQTTRHWYHPTVMGGKIYFEGHSSAGGRELWSTNGTAPGTVMVKDINPGTGSSYFQSPCVLGNRLFFVADDGTNGDELWQSDGTAAGTVLFRDHNPGRKSSWISGIWNVGSRHFYFVPENGPGRGELWVSDGTTKGTGMVCDIWPGLGASWAYGMTLCAGKVLFQAMDPLKGEELFAVDPGATRLAIGWSNRAGLALDCNDPVIATTMTMTVAPLPVSQAGVVILGLTTKAPIHVAGSGFYWNIISGPSFPFSVMKKGSTGSVVIPIPNTPALTGLSMTGQAFVGPTTTGPFFVDFTNGVKLTFGN